MKKKKKQTPGPFQDKQRLQFLVANCYGYGEKIGAEVLVVKEFDNGDSCLTTTNNRMISHYKFTKWDLERKFFKITHRWKKMNLILKKSESILTKDNKPGIRLTFHDKEEKEVSLDVVGEGYYKFRDICMESFTVAKVAAKEARKRAKRVIKTVSRKSN